MPGYIIHLAEAELILKKLQDKNIHPAKEWKQQFQYGALLPDAVSGSGKKKSHFWREADMDQIVIAPDLEAFMKQYSCHLQKNPSMFSSASLPDPLLCGYLAHLHLDQCFFGRYFDRCVEFIDENGTPQKQFQKIHAARIRKSQEVVSLEQFFSNEYLYGDYTKLNHYFVEKYKLEIPVYPTDVWDDRTDDDRADDDRADDDRTDGDRTDSVSNSHMNDRLDGIGKIPECKVKEVRFEDLQAVLESLTGFLEEGAADPDGKLNVFPEEGDTLEVLLEEAAGEFIERIGNLQR